MKTAFNPVTGSLETRDAKLGFLATTSATVSTPAGTTVSPGNLTSVRADGWMISGATATYNGPAKWFILSAEITFNCSSSVVAYYVGSATIVKSPSTTIGSTVQNMVVLSNSTNEFLQVRSDVPILVSPGDSFSIMGGIPHEYAGSGFQMTSSRFWATEA